MPPLKLIFAHPPKSSGTSIRAAVTEFFSHDLMLADYGDRLNDPISPMNIDPCGFLSRYRRQNAAILANKAAVVGHFWIAKYEGVAADVRATILGPDHSRYLSIGLHKIHICGFADNSWPKKCRNCAVCSRASRGRG
jgi:hypothetical protein